MEPDTNNFGARLRELITERKMSLLDFSRDYGISEAQVHNWLKRADAPLAKHWPKLAKFFGVSEAYIGIGAKEKVESAVAEDHAPYLTGAAAMKSAIREHFERLLAAAGDDPGRLGWLREELIRSLPVPAHWPSGEVPRVLVPVTLPSQTQPLSSKTGQPLPPRVKPARSA